MLLSAFDVSYKQRSRVRALGSHYSFAQVPELIQNWGKHAVENIQFLNDPTIIYTGMSGIAAATAIAMCYKDSSCLPLKMAYIRKPREASHGMKIEYSINQKVEYRHNQCQLIECTTAVVVDDFIAQGGTLLRMLKYINAKKLIFLAQQDHRGAYKLTRSKKLKDLDFDINRDYYWTP